MTKSKAKSAAEKKAEKEAKALAKKNEAAAKKKIADAKKKADELKKKREDGNTEGIYFLSLSVNGGADVFESENENLAEAILALKPTVQIKTKALLTLTYGDKSQEILLYAKQLKRPLVNSDSAIFLSKQLLLRLK